MESSTTARFQEPQREAFIQGIPQQELVFPAEAVHFLNVQLLGAHVVIVASDARESKVRLQWVKDRPDLLPVCRLEGNTLSISTPLVSAVTSLVGQKEKFIVEVEVPQQTVCTVQLKTGSLFVEGLTGALDTQVFVGNIQGWYRGANLHASVGVGNVKLQGLVGSAQVQVGTGQTELVWTSLTEASAQINVHCAAGNIALRFPKELAAYVDSSRSGWQARVIANQLRIPIQAHVFLGNLHVESASSV